MCQTMDRAPRDLIHAQRKRTSANPSSPAHRPLRRGLPTLPSACSACPASRSNRLALRLVARLPAWRRRRSALTRRNADLARRPAAGPRRTDAAGRRGRLVLFDRQLPRSECAQLAGGQGRAAAATSSGCRDDGGLGAAPLPALPWAAASLAPAGAVGQTGTKHQQKPSCRR